MSREFRIAKSHSFFRPQLIGSILEVADRTNGVSASRLTGRIEMESAKKNENPKDQVKWEIVWSGNTSDKAASDTTSRDVTLMSKIPGGRLYRHISLFPDNRAESMVFVPNP